MNTAKVLKETEKAYFLHMGVDVWEEMYYIKTWMPKSQITVENRDADDVISFTTKNDWILFSKVKDYVQYCIDNGLNVSETKKTFLRFGTKEDVNHTYYTTLNK